MSYGRDRRSGFVQSTRILGIAQCLGIPPERHEGPHAPAAIRPEPRFAGACARTLSFSLCSSIRANHSFLLRRVPRPPACHWPAARPHRCASGPSGCRCCPTCATPRRSPSPLRTTRTCVNHHESKVRLSKIVHVAGQRIGQLAKQPGRRPGLAAFDLRQCRSRHAARLAECFER